MEDLGHQKVLKVRVSVTNFVKEFMKDGVDNEAFDGSEDVLLKEEFIRLPFMCGSEIALLESGGAIWDVKDGGRDRWGPCCACDGKVVCGRHGSSKMAVLAATPVGVDLGSIALYEAKKLFNFFVCGRIAEAQRLLEAGKNFDDRERCCRHDVCSGDVRQSY